MLFIVQCKMLRFIVNIFGINMIVILKSNVEFIFVMIVSLRFWKETAFSQMFITDTTKMFVRMI